VKRALLALRHPGESMRANVGRIGDRSFASIDSGSGIYLETNGEFHAPPFDSPLLTLWGELNAEYMRTTDPDRKNDLAVARGILFSLFVRW
jgi:hypothetical protein